MISTGGLEAIWSGGSGLQQEERYLCREKEPPITLLPGEEASHGEGVPVTLRPGTCVAGAAGTGGIAAGDGYMLGAWCSFSCRLAVPRRFAARKGRQMAQGVRTEQILQDVWREMLQRLLMDMDQPAPGNTVQLKRQLDRQLRETAQKEMLDLGWQLTHCRLEKILITRSETHE